MCVWHAFVNKTHWCTLLRTFVTWAWSTKRIHLTEEAPTASHFGMNFLLFYFFFVFGVVIFCFQIRIRARWKPQLMPRL